MRIVPLCPSDPMEGAGMGPAFVPGRATTVATRPNPYDYGCDARGLDTYNGRRHRGRVAARFGADHFRKWDDTFAFFVGLSPRASSLAAGSSRGA